MKNVKPTGNPFVDTGRIAMIYLKEKELKVEGEDLSEDDIRQIHGALFHRLARLYRNLPSFTMFFTTNSLLFQPSYKGKQIEYYYKTMDNVCDAIGKEPVDKPCEACGNPKTVDIDLLVRNVAGRSSGNEKRVIGREWFPLSGSIGNDAQALPDATEPPHICATCLLLANYAPLASILYNGKLALLTSDNQQLIKGSITDIIEDNYNKIQLARSDLKGKKNPNELFKIMLNIDTEARKKEGGIVGLWLFTNSGQNPSISFQIIPNSVLLFINELKGKVGSDEVRRILNIPHFDLLESIINGKDTWALYPNPKKKYGGVSGEFYFLYQNICLGRSAEAIILAQKIAEELRQHGEKADTVNTGNIKKAMVSLVKAEKATSIENISFLKLDQASRRRMVRFYLATGAAIPSWNAVKANVKEDEVLWLASTIFRYRLNDKGRQWLQDRVKSVEFERPSFIYRSILRAALKAPINYQVIRKAIMDESGVILPDRLFLIRLLFMEWLNSQPNLPNLKPAVTSNASGLDDEVEAAILKNAADREAARGDKRYMKELYEICNSLYNLINKKWLFNGIEDEKINKIIYDDGRISADGLFRIALLLANNYSAKELKNDQV